MREAGKSPFMALPTELRCHIYSYLQDIVYEPVFSGPGICKWEVYRMPTALLQLNKTIYEELKHPSMQKTLQKANDRLPPNIVLCPRRSEMHAAYLAVSDAFRQVGIRLYTYLGEPTDLGNGPIENIGLDLARWYNRPAVFQGYPSEAALATWTRWRTERVDRFVRQTLRRMAVRKTCEVYLRVLVHPAELPGKENESREPPFNYTCHNAMTALLAANRALEVHGGVMADTLYYISNTRQRELLACLVWLSRSDECFARGDSTVPSLPQ